MASRVDANGAAKAGSQLQTQLYVNKRTAALDDAIREALPELSDATLAWRSPRADDHFREYQDADFLKLLGLDDHVDALARFWPRRGGPHWDALAEVHFPGSAATGAVLVEGKSYTNEMLKGSSMSAKDPESRRLIEQALAWTQGWLCVALDVGAWTGPLYQNANRIAHLCWLRSRGVRAWLVHLLFSGDLHGDTTEKQWHLAVEEANERLGLTGIDVAGATHVLLPAGTRDELLR